MDINVITMLSLMIFGALSSWLFRKLNLPDVIGYILGGLTAASLLTSMGIDIGGSLSYLEPLRWLGLTLFSFTIGSSIGFQGILNNLQKVVASELIVYTVAWVGSSFIANILGLNYLERLSLFILLINSSTAALVSMIRFSNSLGHSLDRVIVQTSAEDLAQFVLFTIMFIAGAAIRMNIFNALTQIVLVIGLIIILMLLGKTLLGSLSKTAFVKDRENKFIVVLGTAIIFASIASSLGLPPLFGAFIAGAAFSLYLSLEDVEDMVNGLKNLGLLLYFTSLGAQIHIEIMRMDNVENVFLAGVFLGFTSYLLRFLGLFISTLITDGSVVKSFTLALNLGLVSEMGIIFIDSLASNNSISSSMVVLSTIAFITSVTIFGALSTRLTPLASVVEHFFPSRVAAFFRNIGIVYMERIDLAIELMKPIAKFTAISLGIVYLNSVITRIANTFGLNIAILVTTGVAISTTLILVYIATLRNILNTMLKSLSKPLLNPVKALNMLINIVAGFIAIALQVNVFHEVIQSLPSYGLPLHIIMTIVGVSSIAITIYEFLKYTLEVRRF